MNYMSQIQIYSKLNQTNEIITFLMMIWTQPNGPLDQIWWIDQLNPIESNLTYLCYKLSQMQANLAWLILGHL